MTNKTHQMQVFYDTILITINMNKHLSKMIKKKRSIKPFNPFIDMATTRPSPRTGGHFDGFCLL